MPFNSSSRPPRLFVHAGMPRAGTTYVYHAFAAHPEAYVPYRKELRFFSLNYHRGPDWYARFFRSAPPHTVCVDMSPDYFLDRAAPARLRDFSPTVKVALAIRDPAAWAVSLHRQLRLLENKSQSFSDFLLGGEYPDFGFPWFRRRNPSLHFSLRSGLVRNQTAAFCAALGERLLLYDFAWFERNPLAALRTLESFLGLTPFFAEANLPAGRINSGNRESAPWIDYLSSRDSLVNLAGALLPRRWLVSRRMKRDQASVNNPGNSPATPPSADLARAREALALDLAYVKTLFARSPVLLGNGLPYAWAPPLPASESDPCSPSAAILHAARHHL